MAASIVKVLVAAFWNVFTVILETGRRVVFAWARVDRLACWRSVGMFILALFIGSTLCFWSATAAITCLSIAVGNHLKTQFSEFLP